MHEGHHGHGRARRAREPAACAPPGPNDRERCENEGDRQPAPCRASPTASGPTHPTDGTHTALRGPRAQLRGEVLLIGDHDERSGVGFDEVRHEEEIEQIATQRRGERVLGRERHRPPESGMIRLVDGRQECDVALAEHRTASARQRATVQIQHLARTKKRAHRGRPRAVDEHEDAKGPRDAAEGVSQVVDLARDDERLHGKRRGCVSTGSRRGHAHGNHGAGQARCRHGTGAGRRRQGEAGGGVRTGNNRSRGRRAIQQPARRCPSGLPRR